MFFPIPPLVILVPAMLPLGIELMATRIGLGTPFSVIPNRLIESHLGMLNRMLTLASVVIGVHQRDRNEPGQRRHQQGGYCRLAYSLNQDSLLSSKHSWRRNPVR